MSKISAKLKRRNLNGGAKCRWCRSKLATFGQITRYNSKTSTVASVVNLVRSQVNHTERPPLFAARFTFAVMQHVTSRGFVSDSWYLFVYSCAAVDKIHWQTASRGPCAIAEPLWYLREARINYTISVFNDSECILAGSRITLWVNLYTGLLEGCTLSLGFSMVSQDWMLRIRTYFRFLSPNHCWNCGRYPSHIQIVLWGSSRCVGT